MDRHVRAEEQLAEVIRKQQRGLRDVQRASGTEKAGLVDAVQEMVPEVAQAKADAAQAIEDAANALTTSNGKNARRRGITEPEPPPGGWVPGDQWVVNNADGQPVEVRVWDGSTFTHEQLLASELLVLSGGLIRLADGTVTADAIAADAIDGMIITGAIIRTAATGQRMQFDANGLAAYNSSGQKTITMLAGTGGIDLVSPVTPEFVGSISNAQAKFERADLTAWAALGLDGVAAEDHTGGVYKVGALRPTYMSLVGRSAGSHPANNERSIQAKIQDDSAHLMLEYRKAGDLSPGAVIHGRVFHDGTEYRASLEVNGAEVATELDLPGEATESVLGVVQRATQAEVNAGTDTSGYVTPATLRGVGPLHYSGTVAEREATTARFGDFWYDIDEDRIVWKGASDGRWRQKSGRASDIARAWGTTSGTQAGRTITFSLPTWLEDHEDIAISSRTVGSGYGSVSLNGVTTDPVLETTSISVRFMQILSVATQPCAITWWIEDQGA